MNISHTVLGLILVLAVSLVSFSDLRADEEKQMEAETEVTEEVEVTEVEMILMTPEDMAWGDVPNAFPPGAKITVLEGDPHVEGQYTLRLMFPADYKIPAHWHTMVERVSVLSGALYAGMGDKLDPEKSKEFPAGSFIFIPAKMNHFAWTKDETVVQINGDGPFDIVYIDPADDPRTAKAE